MKNTKNKATVKPEIAKALGYNTQGKETKKVNKRITLETARTTRDYFEGIIYKALRNAGMSKKAAENIISCYFHYQTLVEKKVKTQKEDK